MGYIYLSSVPVPQRNNASFAGLIDGPTESYCYSGRYAQADKVPAVAYTVAFSELSYISDT